MKAWGSAISTTCSYLTSYLLVIVEIPLELLAPAFPGNDREGPSCSRGAELAKADIGAFVPPVSVKATVPNSVILFMIINMKIW